MKALQGLLLFLILLLAISTAFAYCGEAVYSGCGSSGCSEGVCSECECTDPECLRGSNPCMSKAKCCEAFGNVGAR